MSNKDNKSLTPLDIALRKAVRGEGSDVAELLLKYGAKTGAELDIFSPDKGQSKLPSNLSPHKLNK